jgi:hypothetical protein
VVIEGLLNDKLKLLSFDAHYHNFFAYTLGMQQKLRRDGSTTHKTLAPPSWALLWLLFVPTLLLAADPAPEAAARGQKWENTTPEISGSKLRFLSEAAAPAPDAINLPPLQDPRWIGWLWPQDRSIPYLLVSGVSPESHDAELHLLRADGKTKPQRVTFPGRLLDPKNRSVVHESRAFFGRCLPGQKHDALLLYQRDRVDKRNRLNASLFVAEASPQNLTERLIEKRIPKMTQLKEGLRSKRCVEISGKNRFFQPQFFRFKNRTDEELEKQDLEKEQEKEAEKGSEEAEESPPTSS